MKAFVLFLCATSFLLVGCGDDPFEPPEPVRLDGSFEAIYAYDGELPVRFDQFLPPPDRGEWWAMFLEAATLTFTPDGRYRMIQSIRDSFPDGKQAFQEWRVIGTYEVEEDTIIRFSFDPDSTLTKITPGEGRIRPNDRIAVDLLGLTFERED